MAKKKVARQRVWLHEDFVELLAWLDHAIQHDDVDFQTTIIDHLKESRQKEFTIPQVETKLRGSWTNYGINDQSREAIGWRDDVLRNGSSCLTGLSGREKDDIAFATQALEDGYNTRHPFPSLRLRKRSRLGSSGNNGATESPETPRHETPRKYRFRTQTQSITPSTIKRESEAVEKSPIRAHTSAEGKRRSTPRPIATLLTKPDQPSPTPFCSRSTRGKRVLPASTSQPAPAVDDSEAEHYDSESVELGIAEEIVINHPSNCESRHKHSSSNVNETLNQGYVARLATAIAEIKDLQQRLRQKDLNSQSYEERIKKLEDDVDLLRSVQIQGGNVDRASFYNLIERKDRYIKKLVQDLEDREFLGTFTKLLPASRAWFGETNKGTNLVEGFGNIYTECKQILYRYEGSASFATPPLSEHKSLRLLVRTGLGLDPYADWPMENTMLDFSKLSLQAIIRALTTSALREWIFESNFPQLRTEKSDLLAKYREHLAKQDGVNVLRNLDLAAHETLVKDADFRRSISEKADDLAIKLSQTLSPLFTGNPSAPAEISWDGFETWGQSREEWRERRLRLINIFTESFQVKADSILNIEDYEMFIYPPGTEYDEKTMTVETMEGMIDNGDYDGKKIELCIEAAIYAYPRQALREDAPIPEVIVKSRNFIHKEASQRYGIEPIVKAVVVLKDDLQNNVAR